ncbi:unnamed protein product [Lampetra planeri]
MSTRGITSSTATGCSISPVLQTCHGIGTRCRVSRRVPEPEQGQRGVDSADDGGRTKWQAAGAAEENGVKLPLSELGLWASTEGLGCGCADCVDGEWRCHCPVVPIALWCPSPCGAQPPRYKGRGGINPRGSIVFLAQGPVPTTPHLTLAAAAGLHGHAARATLTQQSDWSWGKPDENDESGARS